MATAGRNKAASSLLDLQPTAILELFKIYPDKNKFPSQYVTFHGGSIYQNNLTWQGVEYLPLPIETEGFGTSSEELQRPKVRVANTDKVITAFLQNYSDFKNAVILRKRVFVKHLDDVNFDNNNPFGDADPTAEISEETYLISYKVQENKNFVEFELTSPLDLENFEVNPRNVSAKYCFWQYRGLGCEYQGPPVEKSNGKPFRDPNGDNVTPILNSDDWGADPSYLYDYEKSYTKGEATYIENPKVIINNPYGQSRSPLKVWYVCVQNNSNQWPENNPSYWQRDGCEKNITACKKHFSDQKIEYFEKGITQSFGYIGASGRGTDNPVQFKTENDYITGVFDGDSWTLLGWIRGNAINNRSYPQTIFSTFENFDSERVDQLYQSTSGWMTLDKFWDATESPSKSIYRLKYQKGKGGRAFESRKLGTETNHDDFHFFMVRASNVTTDPNTQVQYFDDFQTTLIDTSTKLTKPEFNKNLINIPGGLLKPSESGGTSFFEFFCLFGSIGNGRGAFHGDISNFSLYSKKLNNTELWEIFSSGKNWKGINANVTDGYGDLSLDPQKFYYMPVDYTNMTNNWKNGVVGSRLVAWWNKGGFIDNEQGNAAGDLTAGGTTSYHTGDVDYLEEATSKLNNKAIAAAQNWLPFGGFPGTDGYNYQDRV